MPKPIKDKRSPNWQYDFQRNGRRFYGSTGTANKRAAQRYIDNLVNEIAEGKDGKTHISLNNACDALWQDKAQFERSHRTTEYQLANLIQLIGANKSLADITVKDFNDYIAKRRATVSGTSINRELEQARRVWKHASKSHLVSTIDWGALRLSEPKERVRELSAKEEQRLFDALPESLKPVVEFAILSGQRRSAVIGLRWDKIDWMNGEAEIVNKGGGVHRFPLSPVLVQLILEQPQLDDCPYVFTYVCERPAPKRPDRPQRIKGQRYPFTVQGWKRKWQRALAEAGIENFRFHDLRHTSATRIMRASGNLKAAQKLLGHTDIRTTSRYAHVGMDDLRELMNVTESRNSTGKRLTNAPKTGIIPSVTED